MIRNELVPTKARPVLALAIVQVFGEHSKEPVLLSILLENDEVIAELLERHLDWLVHRLAFRAERLEKLKHIAVPDFIIEHETRLQTNTATAIEKYQKYLEIVNRTGKYASKKERKEGKNGRGKV